MPDVKKEQLAHNQFICKVCWKKNENLKFRITVSDCDMGCWNETGEGFSICDECFSGMISFIDIKAGDIIDNMINSINKYEDASKGGHILLSVIDRRLGDLNRLKDKLKETIGDRRNQKQSGGENE